MNNVWKSQTTPDKAKGEQGGAPILLQECENKTTEDANFACEATSKA